MIEFYMYEYLGFLPISSVC